MATRKEAKKKSLLQLLAVIIAVVVIVVAVVLFQNWRSTQPGAQPQDIKVTASVGDESMEVAPYMVCEPGADCPEGEVPNLVVGENDTLKIEVPDDIASNQWQLLTIYDDPAANDEQLHGAGETTVVEVPGSVEGASEGKKAHLAVVEISAVLLGTNEGGEETPYTAVWSLSTLPPDELAAVTATSSAPAE
ncbi:DUF2771 domain-containing protein [Corynebacterium phoceense]